MPALSVPLSKVTLSSIKTVDADLQQSRAELMHFCFELQKKMKLIFKNPTQPVDVNIRSGAGEHDLGNLTRSPLTAPSSPGADNRG